MMVVSGKNHLELNNQFHCPNNEQKETPNVSKSIQIDFEGFGPQK